MTKIFQFAFAASLSLVMIADFCLSSPWFAPQEKIREREFLSFAGFGAPHSYFSNPSSHRFEFEVQVRSADGQLLELFTPASQYPPLFSNLIFARGLDVDDSDVLIDSCERLGGLLGRGPDTQVMIYLRDMQLRTFKKFEIINGGSFISRIEIVKAC